MAQIKIKAFDFILHLTCWKPCHYCKLNHCTSAWFQVRIFGNKRALLSFLTGKCSHIWVDINFVNPVLPVVRPWFLMDRQQAHCQISPNFCPISRPARARPNRPEGCPKSPPKFKNWPSRQTRPHEFSSTHTPSSRITHVCPNIYMKIIWIALNCRAL